MNGHSLRSANETGVRAIFEQIRSLLADRGREIESSSFSEDDEAAIHALAKVARQEPMVDKMQLLHALLAGIRRKELRRIEKRIAVLGYESFGQELRLPEGAWEEEP